MTSDKVSGLTVLGGALAAAIGVVIYTRKKYQFRSTAFAGHKGRLISPEAAARVRAAQAYGTEEFRELRRQVPGPLAPAFPDVPDDIAARIVRGEAPEQIAEGRLTRREAHQWLTEGAPRNVQQWLLTKLMDELRSEPEGEELPPLRDPRVAKWLLDVRRRGHWPVLTHTRRAPIPRARRPGTPRQYFHFHFMDRIQDVFSEDLVRGISTTPEQVFEHAAEREGRMRMARYAQDYRPLAPMPRGWRLYRSMHHLATGAALVAEGEEMAHCVATYIPGIERRESVIFGIKAGGGRSTAELSPEGQVVQHYGPGNLPPSVYCKRVLGMFVRRLGTEQAYEEARSEMFELPRALPTTAEERQRHLRREEAVRQLDRAYVRAQQRYTDAKRRSEQTHTVEDYEAADVERREAEAVFERLKDLINT